MRPANLRHFYRVRLRARALQEGFAVLGIAAGVALLFASQVASSSLLSSVAQLSRGIVGHATLQLIARDDQGFPEAMLARVRAIGGVALAAPLLEASANARGPKGSESVELVGADASLARLGGALVRHTRLEPFGGIGAVVLPAPLAHAIGVTKFGAEATFELYGRTARAPLYEQLHKNQIGPLVESPIAVAPLFFAQEMAGLQGRVSRILVQPAPGREARVRAALQRLAAGRLDVEPTSYDEALFAKAAGASDQSTALFAVISALVGFLFAFNAMLLSAPQRRRLIAELRREGYQPRAVIAVLLLDALALGALGCALGLALGEELSIHLFHAAPGYLSSAFAVGSQRVVSVKSVAVAAGGGMLASVVAVLSPLRAILSPDPLLAGAPRPGRGAVRPVVWPALAGVLCLGAAGAILFAAPQAAVWGMVLLIGALLAELPLALTATLALAARLARARTGVAGHVAVMELTAARTRAVAIAATGAVAVFGAVAIQGAHADLLAGLDDAARDTNAFADVWVAPAGSYNLLHTAPFAPSKQAALARLPGVRAVRVYRGGLLDVGERRVWVIAPPGQASALLPASQIVEGDPRRASERVRAGGWVVLSRGLAEELHARIGQAVTLPSPVPSGFRVAAISTDIGWAPGAIVMSAADYARAWGGPAASAYDVLLDPGVSRQAAVGEIARALGPGSGLAVETAARHAGRERSLSRQGLARLGQIAALILVGAVLAMAAAMGAMLWQRRPRLAKLKLEGFSRAQLWRTVLLESVLLLGTGCVLGAAFGLYGQQLLDKALASVIGFPVVASVAVPSAAVSLALVLTAAALVLAAPGWIAVRVPAGLALAD